MPLLDVADILDDPDFNQRIVVDRTEKETDERGETICKTTPMEFIGVAVPITAQELIRLPDAERLSGGLTVYSRFPLVAGDGAITADVVTVNQRCYTVISVDDFGAFGAGFTVARCSLRSLRNDDGPGKYT
ncbi:hypothetical protein K6W36_12410 [Acetobacter senegalensis]|uniref:hypothetical protein n=1 Tax=Acetobacter senegalensis TaxID=446692 RepID=UPI001EDC37E0|nr:hypothetical protein [Acetobacter senegalensis]MCG4261368.1 hypothetical protein [Acetobacter senegalensis]